MGYLVARFVYGVSHLFQEESFLAVFFGLLPMLLLLCMREGGGEERERDWRKKKSNGQPNPMLPTRL